MQISFKQKQAVVLVAGEQYDAAVLVHALERAGFHGKVLKESPVRA